MAITSLADYAAALKQTVLIKKSISSQQSTTGWNVANVLGSAGVMAIGNTTTGIVPTSATAGATPLAPFSGVGYLTSAEFTAHYTSISGATAARIMVYDRLFHVGSVAHGTTATLSGQPSYSSRVPGGTDYSGLLLIAESIGVSSTNTITVTYTDQSGNMGHTTGAFSWADGGSNDVADFRILPLQSGDTGLQTIESVAIGGAGTSSFNIIVARPLWTGVVETTGLVNNIKRHGLEQTGMPQVFSDSCLTFLYPDSGGAPSIQYAALEIASA